MKRTNARLACAGCVAGLLWATNLHAQTLDPWQTIDACPGYTSLATAVAGDEAGNIYAAGMWFQNVNDVRHGWIRKSSDGGRSWATVEDLVYPGSVGSVFQDITADGAGNLYAIAWATIRSGPAHWVVTRSTDGGATWSIVDDLLGTPFAVAADAAGNINVIGGAGGHSILRRSSDGGSSWMTLSEFTYRGGSAQANAVVSTAAGLFVAGLASNPQTGGSGHWLVWRSEDAGVSWTLADDYQYRAGYASTAKSLVMDDRGNLYVTGLGYMPVKKINRVCWVTRRSTDGGASWATVDAFQYISGKDSQPYKIGTGADGTVYMVGQGGDSTLSGTRWLVRKSADAGRTWTLSDSFQLTRGRESGAKGLAQDSLGNLYTVGFGYNAAGDNWLVRKFAP